MILRKHLKFYKKTFKKLYNFKIILNIFFLHGYINIVYVLRQNRAGCKKYQLSKFSGNTGYEIPCSLTTTKNVLPIHTGNKCVVL